MFSIKAPMSRGVQRPKRRIRVCDCRLQTSGGSSGLELETSGMDFIRFMGLLVKKFPVPSDEMFVVATTDRRALDSNTFEELQDGCTLYLLHKLDQDLPAAMEEHITFIPHYDTLIKGGLYEYYDSEGHNSLSYTLAELIDNSLWATSKNTERRTIEIRMVGCGVARNFFILKETYDAFSLLLSLLEPKTCLGGKLFDESVGKAAIIALDNGCGMTSQKLRDWAVYRCSKFNRPSEKYFRPDPTPRSLNSDISYFGVGGKQAIFYIGESVRMITKSVGCSDVHELILSKEDFKRKEENKEDIYKSIIKHRKPGDRSHVIKGDERFLHSLIAEERGKESFTAVVITGIRPEHVAFLKQDFKVLTRQLAHTYHYYIHGVNGNDPSSSFTNSDHSKIDIQVTLREKPPKFPRVVNLREIDDDMQTLYIKAAADTFEFRATTGVDTGRVEGIIRYHPFLYDKETYPLGPEVAEAPEEDCDGESGVRHQATGKRPIFECFWNGRLIPYTTVHEFDWCACKDKGAKVPEDCYSRFSGVLFTDDKFLVTANKLTFMDLEQRVNGRETIFTRVVNGQEQRTTIQKEFTDWLKNCHENLDKQVKFLGFRKIETRSDMGSKKIWSTFSAIELDGKMYKTGQLVKSLRTQPIIRGTVLQFLLNGEHNKDVFATGGSVEVRLEPKALYNRNRIIPISKIDRNATDEGIKKGIENDLCRLPHELKVIWQESNEWPQNGVYPAGTPLGPLRVEIMNKKGEGMSRMPATSQGAVIKLSVKLTVVKNGPEKADEVLSLVAQHSAKWSFWFKKIEKLNDTGSYTLSLNTLINDSGATVFGGRDLPISKISFTITAGKAEAFVVGEMSSTLHVSVPFDIPLQITDGYGNSTKPLPGLLPELECRDLEVSYATVDCSGSKFIIKGVKARGKVLNNQPAKKYDLRVTLPGLKKPTQTIKISLLPGIPHTLHVKTDDNPIVIENRTTARFNVEVHDEAGNVTTHPRQIVHCQVQVPGLTPATVDCSRTGAGQLVTKPISLKIVGGEPQKLKVTFEMPSRRNVESVVRELTVIPSPRVSQIIVCSQNDKSLVLRNDDKISWLAGGSLENLFYNLYDEAGRAVPITKEIASMIKVNWTKHVDVKELLLGKLPVVQVPTQVQQEERFYQVSYQDQSVSVSFTIVPRPDEPAKLKTTLPLDTVKLGETLSGTINLELVDKYDNATRTLTATCVKDLNVKAEGLDKEAVVFQWRENSRSVDVTGICFLHGTPGIKNLLFTYQTYTTYQIVNVTAGDPALLKLVGGPSQPLQVINDHSIPTPFLIQLVDEWGNVSTDKRVVVVIKSSPPGLKVSSDVVSQPVDSEGKASFTVNSVSGQRGCYQLDFDGSLNNKHIPGPTVNLTVLPNPNKPVSLIVDYSTAARFPAGGTFPVFSVTVVSDEGSPMTTFKPAAVTMLLWEGEASDRRPPQPPTELTCNKPMENERKDCFHFRDKKIPETAGNHTVQFSLRIDQTNFLLSNKITLNVVANQPVKLAPESQPPAPVVSCCRDVKNRTLVQDMTLRIMDSYGNPAGKDLVGKLVVSITNCGGDGAKPTPLFEGRLNRYEISLAEGQVHITRLAIMENSPGEDGSEYTLRFQPDVPLVPTPLAPFELTFHYYNDAVNQQRVCDLLKRKERLSSAVSVHKQLFDGYSELLNLYTTQHQTASIKVADQREVLKRKNVTVTESIPALDQLLAEKTKAADEIRTAVKRVCSLSDDFMGQQDVLGKVGHLAYVQDDAAARVISWHIRGDMDCVITVTTEAARRINEVTRGQQQVWPLDSMFAPQMNRPLPHIRNGLSLFEPSGNPVFARNLLIFPRDQESCAIVFAIILGETILIDDLDSASDYRRALVQKKIRCPTILTRQGDRINAGGKFGGAQNKVPPMTSFKVFGAPLPELFYALQDHIDLLRQYRTAVEKKEKVEKERDDHSKLMKSPVNIKKQQDKDAKEKQLEEIERQLSSTTMGPMRPIKRGLQDADGLPGSIAKRAK